MLTKEYIQSLFTYDDGRLLWRVSRSRRVKLGQEAGYARKDTGRRVVNVDNRLHYAHRLIFLLHHGWLPEEVDHIDGDPANNRIENLRAATHAQNQWNSARRCDNTSGVKGVCWYPQTRKWTAQIRANGKRKRLGYYPTIEAAAEAIRTAQKHLHGEFAKYQELKSG
jgi:hypothetical protein